MPGLGLESVGGAGRVFGAPPSAPARPDGAGGGQFAQLLGDLADAQSQGDSALKQLAVGGGQDLHDAVLSVEMESLAFELAVQIRNRLVDAYQEIFRMSV